MSTGAAGQASLPLYKSGPAAAPASVRHVPSAGMTVLRDVMFLPEPVPSLLGAAGGSAVARHAASVVAARPLAEGVASPPLTSEDVTALRCDASNFVSEQETPEKPVS